MKQLVCVLVFFTIIGCSNESKVLAQIPTDMELQEKREKLTVYQLSDIDYHMIETSKLSLRQLKQNAKESYKDFYSRYEKWNVERLNELNKFKKKHPKDTVSSIISSSNNSEKFNDSLYIKYIKGGRKFHQKSINDSSYIDMLGNNSKLNKIYNNINEDVTPSMGFESLSDVFVKKIFYADSSVEQNIKTKYNDCPSPNSSCFLTTKKIQIDSILITHKLYYVSQRDTVLLKKEDVGKTIKGVKVIAFDDNYIIYDSPDKNILDDEAFSINGTPLMVDQGLTDIWCADTPEKEKEYILKIQKKAYESLKNVNTKEDALKIIENNLLDQEIGCIDFARHYYFYKGNIDVFKIYKEVKRDTLITKAIFVNKTPRQNWYLNSLKDETKFIDRLGNLIFKTPVGSLRYITDNQDQIRNNYFLKSYQNSDDVYYHLDIKNKNITKLDSIRYINVLNEHLVTINYGYDSKGYIVNEYNQKVTDKKYSTIKSHGKLILVTDYIGKFDLLDENGTPTEAKEVNYIGAFYHGVAKVKKGDKFGFIDDAGTFVQSLDYDIKDTYYVRHVQESFAQLQIVKKGEYYGIVDLKNRAKLTVPIEYEEIYEVTNTDNNPAYVVKKKNAHKYYGIIDTQGKIRKPFKYTLQQINELLKNDDF
ncbi:hypothetical protein [Aquimarina sp. I32.4]|uniref:hypothetical protein n=1 Tax=Aquimarina sp. I32.4 TaxID=2053903 RepID=UPI0011AFA9D5|nr:hypothetical protein [Aquimarina sp. I32.4]